MVQGVLKMVRQSRGFSGRRRNLEVDGIPVKPQTSLPKAQEYAPRADTSICGSGATGNRITKTVTQSPAMTTKKSSPKLADALANKEQDNAPITWTSIGLHRIEPSHERIKRNRARSISSGGQDLTAIILPRRRSSKQLTCRPGAL